MSIMIKLVLLFVCFNASFAFSKPPLFLNQLVLVAQDEEFDDSDLADIEEGSYGEDDSDVSEETDDSKDEKLEEEFNDLDYEAVDEEDDYIDGEESKKGVNSLDYEIVDNLSSEKETVKDEALEESFENEDSKDKSEEDLEESFENQDDEDSKDKSDEGLEESFENEDDEDSKDKSDEGLEESFENQDDEALEESFENEDDEDSKDKSDEDDLDDEDSSEEVELSVDDTSSVQSEGGALNELNLIRNIRFISGKDQIIIDASEATSYQIRKNENNNQLIIEILQSKLGKNLNWPYVLKDFNTNFGLVKADQKTPDVVRVVIQFKEKSSFPKTKLSETGNQIVIGYGDLSGGAQIGDEQDYVFEEGGSSEYLEKQQVLPAKTLEELYFGKIKFSGKPISFHVIDAPIKQVLRFISEESGLNMVIGEGVTGSITLKLENIPWDQALYTIFKVKSLGYTRDGNVITILLLKEIEERTKKLKEIAEQQKPLIPLVTKVIPVTYGKLTEIETKVKGFLTPADSNNKQVGGQIIVHEESNTLIVIDTEKSIAKIEKLIAYLDKTPKQVMIEVKIVEASENFAKSFELNWSLGGNLPATINASGLLELLGNMSGSYGTKVDGGSGSGTFQLSGIPFIGDVTASLNIAEGENFARVVSSPKIVTISGKKASITRNSPILVSKSVTTTSEGNTTSSRETEDVKIQLEVTPTVTSTGNVFLDVSVERSDPGGAGGSFKTTRSAKTEVLVQNGHTVVIGGIYEEDEASVSDGIPFLKNIPFLSLLFNSYKSNNSKSELLVFLTPKLLDVND